MKLLSGFEPSKVSEGIAAFTVLVIAIGWAVTLLYLRDSREHEMAQVMRSNANLARAFEEHTIRTIKQIDQLVLLVSAQYQVQGAKLDLARFMREAGANPELVVIVAVLDPRGNAVVTNTPAPSANVADRDHFKFHASTDSGKLFIGQAVMGRLGGRWLMPMSRRINKADGSFGGAVSIGVDPFYFSNFYRDVDLGRDGVVTLGGRDGFIRARLSTKAAAGQDVRNTAIVNALERSAEGSMVFTSILDGITRVWSYRGLKDYPLYVAVGVSEREALASYDGNSRTARIAAGVVTAVILLFCGWLLRLDAREQRARRTLAMSEQRLSAMLDSIPDPAWLKDAEGRFLAVNRAYAHKRGVEPDAVIGKTVHDFLPADIAAKSTAEEEQVLRTGERLRVERHLFVTGGPDWYDVIKLPIKDARGRVTGIVCIGRDITESRAAKAEVEALNATLKQRADELQFANQELESFSYSVAHDLRTPLRAIHGYSTIVAQKYGAQLGAEGASFLERIRAGASRMAELIEALLDLARVGRTQLRLKQIDLSNVVRAHAAQLKQEQPTRPVEIAIADGIVVKGDAALLQVVVCNLLDNAWKFTCERDPARIEFGLVLCDGTPTCFVRDNGVGFDERNASMLFRPFSRLHGPNEFGGHGVGLATVKRILQRHGQHVWAESESGRGATFYFTVTLVSAPEALRAQPAGNSAAT